jgi:CHAT domain-containing protein
MNRLRTSAGYKVYICYALLACLFACKGDTNHSAKPSVRAEILAAIGPIRCFEGRVAEMYSYAPFHSEATENIIGRQRLRKLNALKRRLDSLMYPDSQVGLALLDLLDKKPERAADRLKATIEQQPNNYTAANDLAVSFLASDYANEGSYYAVLALEAAKRAIDLNPRRPEAHFNFALSLDRLFLIEQACAAWREYLRLDSSSEWANEARIHLRALAVKTSVEDWIGQKPRLISAIRQNNNVVVREIVSKFRYSSRLYTESEILGVWAQAVLERRPLAASTALYEARTVALLLAQVGGDTLLRDTIAVIDAAYRSNRKSQLRLLAEGHSSYIRGLRFFSTDNDEKALKEFYRAQYILNAAKSPFAEWVATHVATCAVYMKKYDKALSVLGKNQLGSVYPVVSGRSRWLVGLVSVMRDDFAISLVMYRSALADFELAGEAENVAAVHFLIAENLRFQGQIAASWVHRYKALQISRLTGSPQWYHNSLFDAAEVSRAQGLNNSALLFQLEMVQSKISLRDPISLSEALLRLGSAHFRVGNIESAIQDLKTATVLIDQVRESHRRLPLRADFNAVAADVYLRKNPRKSLSLLRASIGYHLKFRDYFRLPELYRKSAEAQLALDNALGAEVSLENGIAEVGSAWGKLSGEQLLVSYGEQVQPVFNAMVRLQVEKGASAVAFNYVEASRSQDLLKGFGQLRTNGERSKSTLGWVRRSLPEDVVVIEYANLGDELMAWVIASEGVGIFKVPARVSIITEEVRKLRRSLKDRSWDARGRALSQWLFDVLIRPSLAHVRGKKVVVFVPDGILYDIPYAALIDAQKNRYLVEDYAVAMAPSSLVYLSAVSRDGRLAQGKGNTALVIGNPRVNKTLFPALPDLPAAEEEARQVAALYENSKLLTGQAAAKYAVKSLANRYDILHVAAHAVINYEHPFLSSIIFAPSLESGRLNEGGVLYAYELYQMRFSRLRLVVLSACDTLDGYASGFAGIESLARPFLAAGVPAVVGSLWPMSDAEGKSVLLTFHSKNSGTHDALQALRETQLLALRSSNKNLSNPLAWAGLYLVGGTAR